jgi:glycosyltransferase involved in cell wall biosynthesis
MKICTILTCYLPNQAYGGPVHAHTQSFRELIRRGHEVTVLTSNILDHRKNLSTRKWSERMGGVEVLRFPSILFARHFSGILSFQMLNWIRKHAGFFDVFHISYARELIPILATWTLLKLDCKVVIQTHGTLDREDGIRRLIDRLITDKQLAGAHRVVVLQEKEELRIRKKSSKIKTQIIPNGIDLDAELPGWVGPFKERRTILFLARLHPRKNVSGFIRAAGLLHETDPDLEFRIVGPDGGDEDPARKLVKDLGLESSMAFIGSVTRARALMEMANASVYVLPSYDEPFATTIVEALAIGTPVVVTDSVQNLDILKRFDAAEISNHSPMGLAHSIQSLLENPELCLLRSENGKRLVREELDIRSTVDNLESLYRLIHNMGT